MPGALYAAFQIGFIIFTPLVLVDIVAGSMLMALGMTMAPPLQISLPIEIPILVLIDGSRLAAWALPSPFH
jgi:flagellar biosynthetic protein FliP